MNSRIEAYKIIQKVLTKHQFSDKLLNSLKKKHSAEDTEFIHHLVKGVIKYKLQLDYIASLLTEKSKFDKTDGKIKILLYLGIYQLIHCDGVPDHAAINETVDVAKKIFNSKVGNFINAVLRELLRTPEIKYPQNITEKIAYQYSFPADLIAKWLDMWGEEKTIQLCTFFNQNPEIHFRVNHLATNPSKLVTYFQRREIVVLPSEHTDQILVSDQAQQVLQDIAFEEGYYTIQDAAAAKVVELMKPRQHDVILDLFAAPGGKTTYIAESMMDTGEIFAVDKIPARMKLLRQNMERLKLNNIKLFTQDAFQFGPVTPSFDQVLLDVPCSGWGVMQKKAELRWQYHQDIDKMIKLQEKALKYGSQFVTEGGYLVYSTCTLNPEENENQVERFLSKNKRFRLIKAESVIPKEYTENGYLKILPFKHHLDGAFAAKIQKI